MAKKLAQTISTPPDPALTLLVGQFLSTHGFSSTLRIFETEKQSIVSKSATKEARKQLGDLPTLDIVFAEHTKTSQQVTEDSGSESDSDSDVSSDSSSDDEPPAKKDSDVEMNDAVDTSSSESSDNAASDTSDSSSESDSSDEDAPPPKSLKRKASASSTSSSSSASSSSSSRSSTSEDEDDNEPSRPSKRQKVQPTKQESSSSDSESTSDSSADSSDSDSDAESDSAKAAARDLADAVSAPLPESDSSSSDSSADSSSDSSSDDDEDSGEDVKKANIPSQNNSDGANQFKKPKKPTIIEKETISSKITKRADSDSSATLQGDPAPLPPWPADKKKHHGAHPSRLAQISESYDPNSGEYISNTYVSYDYADRAYNDLVVTRGKGFTKEKNKKKRGSYRGGTIDTSGGKGFKFED